MIARFGCPIPSDNRILDLPDCVCFASSLLIFGDTRNQRSFNSSPRASDNNVRDAHEVRLARFIEMAN